MWDGDNNDDDGEEEDVDDVDDVDDDDVAGRIDDDNDNRALSTRSWRSEFFIAAVVDEVGNEPTSRILFSSYCTVVVGVVAVVAVAALHWMKYKVQRNVNTAKRRMMN